MSTQTAPLTAEEKSIAKTAQRKMTSLRNITTDVKNEVDKFADEAKAIIPEDLETMFAGKMCDLQMGSRVAAENIMWSYIRKYLGLTDDQYTKLRDSSNPVKDLEAIIGTVPFLETVKTLLQLQDQYDAGFAGFKNAATKIASRHPLCQSLQGIKGITPYNVALVMSYMKDITRFEKPSQLMMYAGLGAVQDPADGKWYAVCKAHINKIKEIYFNSGREFKGFNTVLSGRMHVIFECLLRGGGFFADFYQQTRTRLELRAINNNETFLPTKEQQKESKGVMKAGKPYMIGKKNQSLIMWSHNNAKRRVARTFLQILWAEWRSINNLPVRDLYSVEYLGHNEVITLQQVLNADSVKRVRKPKEE